MADDETLDDDVSDDTMRTTLAAIRKAQDEHALVEAERTGAAKLTANLLRIFGGLITVAAVAGFVWILEAQEIDQRQDSEIERIKERATEHRHDGVSKNVRAVDRRVDMVVGDVRSLGMRIEKQGERIGELAEEVDEIETAVRRNSNTRRSMTWGD